MGTTLNEFEKMLARAYYDAMGCEDLLQDFLKDMKYYGVITAKTDMDEENHIFTLYIRVPAGSELTIEISKNHCVEAADITLARYIKDKFMKYMTRGGTGVYKAVVKVAIDDDRFWKLEDADSALEQYERNRKNK